MGQIRLVMAFIHQGFPVFSIGGFPKNILVIDSGDFTEKGGIHVLVSIVDLHGINGR